MKVPADERVRVASRTAEYVFLRSWMGSWSAEKQEWAGRRVLLIEAWFVKKFGKKAGLAMLRAIWRQIGEL